MTTITSSIIPTKHLAQWRSKHPGRYPFVLSDSSPSVERSSIDPSCIRNRKAWLIDHTLYISSRNDGTRPINSPNPKKFHEMQWNYEYGTRGRLIEERAIPIASPDRPSETSLPGTTDALLNSPNHSKGLRRYSPGSGILDKLRGRIYTHKEKPLQVEQRRRSWMPNTLMFETASLFRDKRTGPDPATVPLPSGCQVPNAIFARKYLLVETSDSMPPCLSLSQMPTAESKATDTIVEATTKGLLDRVPPWRFRGPFTPQLGFDGGLDYHWNPQEPIVTFRRFDVDSSTQDVTDLCLDGGLVENNSKMIPDHAIQQTSTRRQGVVFNISAVGENENDLTNQLSANYPLSNLATPNSPAATTPRAFDVSKSMPLQPCESSASNAQNNVASLASSSVEQASMTRFVLYRKSL